EKGGGRFRRRSADFHLGGGARDLEGDIPRESLPRDDWQGRRGAGEQGGDQAHGQWNVRSASRRAWRTAQRGGDAQGRRTDGQGAGIVDRGEAEPSDRLGGSPAGPSTPRARVLSHVRIRVRVLILEVCTSHIPFTSPIRSTSVSRRWLVVRGPGFPISRTTAARESESRSRGSRSASALPFSWEA